MALKSNKRAELKAARIEKYWPDVPDWVFKDLGVTRDELEKFATGLLGQVVLPGMPQYEQDRAGNPVYPSYPLIIVYCAAFNDVRLCLEWAGRYGWWVTCRSGGHSIAGFSVNSGMVIDVSEMKYVVVDPALKSARIGAGTDFGVINAALDFYHLHLPGGSCLDVGVAGFMQGGGYGFTSREFGIHCDSLVEASVMLADGRIVIANGMQNRDLYWAIRGGTGNNFGVLLEVKYRLYDLYEAWGFCLQWSIDNAPAALAELQQHYMKGGAPRQLGYLAVLATIDNAPVLVMIGMYHGSRADGLQALSSLRATGNPTFLKDEVGTYSALNQDLLDVLPYPGGTTFELKRGGYIAEPVPPADWDRVAAFFRTTPNPYNIAVIEPYGGAINAYPVTNSAFIHRDASMDFFVDSFWQDGWHYNNRETAQQWLDGFMNVIGRRMNGHVYQNYPVRDLPNFRWAYWGDAFNSLLYVKQKYDPNNFFHFEQSISPYPEDASITRSAAPSMFSDPVIDL